MCLTDVFEHNEPETLFWLYTAAYDNVAKEACEHSD
jgi:hypothetical protein